MTLFSFLRWGSHYIDQAGLEFIENPPPSQGMVTLKMSPCPARAFIYLGFMGWGGEGEREKVSLCSSGCLGTPSIDQACLKLRDHLCLLSAGLKTVPSLPFWNP